MASIHNDDGPTWGKVKEGSDEGKTYYSSFLFEGEEYELYDNILSYDANEAEPHIGKIMKLWEEKANHKKCMLVRWFLRPRDLPALQLDHNSKELFLAFGKGKGVANENRLEVVIGKCKVLCTHKDPRNPQPTEDDLRDANHFFRQIYSVDRKRLFNLDGVVDKVGCAVFFNKPGWVFGGGKNKESEEEGRLASDAVKGDEDNKKQEAASSQNHDLQADLPANHREQEKQSTAGEKSGVSQLESKKRQRESEPVVDFRRKLPNAENHTMQKGSNPGALKRPWRDPDEDKGKKKLKTTEKTEPLPQRDISPGRVGTPQSSSGGFTQGKLEEDVPREQKGKPQAVEDLEPSLLADTKSSGTSPVSTKTSPTGLGLTETSPLQADLEPPFGDNRGLNESDCRLSTGILSADGHDAKPISVSRDEGVAGKILRGDSSKGSETSKLAHTSSFKKDEDTSSRKSTKGEVQMNNQTSGLKHTSSFKKEEITVKAAGGENKPSQKQETTSSDMVSEKKETKVLNAIKSEKMKNIEGSVVLNKKVSFSKDTKPILSGKTGMNKVIGGVEAEKGPSTTTPVARTESTLEKRRIFKELPWEENLQQGLGQGKVLLLHNLDPLLVSNDVRDMLKRVLKGCSDARVVPPDSTSNPYGQALVIFENKDFAESALEVIEEKCLVLTDSKRPLVASKAKLPEASKVARFPGHIPLEKFKLSRQHQNEDMRKAVSTSHCSQPNTIEFEMAMEWRHHQELAKSCWDQLYKKQRDELKDILKKFKPSKFTRERA